MSRAAEIAASINAAYKGKVIGLASDDEYKVEYMPTGMLPFDVLLPGGLPKGRMIEVYGGPSTLKTYFVLHAIAEAQRSGGTCALIDTERTFDPAWATQIGVDTSQLILPDVETGERAFDIAQILVAEGIDILGFDSIAAAQPQSYDSNPLEDTKIQPGRHAALFSLGMRKVCSKNRKTSILFTNQTRMSIGVTFGNPEVTPGGKAPMFYASLRMNISPAGKVHEATKSYNGEKWVDGRRQIAQTFRATMTKSKLSTPYGEVMFDWNMKTNSIDMPKFLVAQAVETGIVQFSGQMWNYGDLQIRGRQNFLDLVAEDESVRDRLEWDIRAIHGLNIPGTTKPRPKKSSPSGSRGATTKPRRIKVVG